MPKASVKIMCSYDYCHFEICLGSDKEMTLTQVDDMRKDAQRLVDKAVKQYKIAKREEQKKINIFGHTEASSFAEARNITKNIPGSEWTPEQKATIKAFLDWQWEEEHQYDYEG